MRAFSHLYARIDETNKTSEKVSAMAAYFSSAPSKDAAWAVSFLIGRRPKRLVSGPKLWGWAVELSGLPDWLFAECYDAVGDVAETITLVLPADGTGQEDLPLHVWVEQRLLPLAAMPEVEQREAIRTAWTELEAQSRFVWNKLITGAFRVGVSQDLVVRALSQASGLAGPIISHRLMGSWEPTARFFEQLTQSDESDADISKPYPFCLAHALDQEPSGLGEIGEWRAEWKWDGIRAQVIRRQGQSFIWSRGEDLITDRFPEVRAICDALPDGTVLDGEILAWSNGRPMKFLELQKRIGRKVVSRRILDEVPVVFVVFDLLEHLGNDIRAQAFADRRSQLELLIKDWEATRAMDLLGQGLDARLGAGAASKRHIGVEVSQSKLLLAAQISASSWEELAELRRSARELNVEGLMLKRRDSPYMVGRKKGSWWKWKIEPFTVDCVLIYAQKGSGKRASLYTDYTFGVWDDNRKLVPFAKAYSGLTDDEIRQVDSFVRRNTLERFGPVRAVAQELVFELAFEAIQLSSRHKSGIAVRFPRISGRRHDKVAADADTLSGIKAMLNVIP